MKTTESITSNDILEKVISVNSGLVIVYGPINSGKSSTLDELADIAKANPSLKAVELTMNSEVGRLGTPQDNGESPYKFANRTSKDFGIPQIIIERGYKFSRKTKDNSLLMKARAMALKTAGNALTDQVNVVFVDETNSPELIQSAKYLSEAGCLVIVAIHAKSDAEALSNLNAVAAPLNVKKDAFNKDDVTAIISHGFIPGRDDLRNVTVKIL